MIFLWILLGLIFIALFISFLAFVYIVHRNNTVIKQVSESHPLYADAMAFNQSNKEEWQQTVADGLNLRAWYLAADLSRNKIVILVNGYNSIRQRFYAFGWFFHSLGYNVLMPEIRASTEAEGRWVGFGWLDKEDFKGWLHLVLEKNPAAEVAFFGVSMGGATVMMLSGEDLPANVKCFIEDCGYDSVWNEIKYQLHCRHLPGWPLLTLMNFWCKIFAGYDWQKASSVKQLSKNTRPILFIHGEKDDYVPFSMLANNLAAIPSTNSATKEVLTVPNAYHGQAYETDISLYQETVKEFLKKYF